MISPVRIDDHEARPTEPPTEPKRTRPWAIVFAELRAATTMLTRLPIRGDNGERTGAAAFGIVGGLIGLAGLIPLVGLGIAVPPIAAILAVAAITVVSGAVHLDGLADTADALMAVGPDGAERARTDPSVGVGGVVAIVLVLAVDAASPGSSRRRCRPRDGWGRLRRGLCGLARRARGVGATCPCARTGDRPGRLVRGQVDEPNRRSRGGHGNWRVPCCLVRARFANRWRRGWHRRPRRARAGARTRSSPRTGRWRRARRERRAARLP